jgi:hypothetical protein
MARFRRQLEARQISGAQRAATCGVLLLLVVYRLWHRVPRVLLLQNNALNGPLPSGIGNSRSLFWLDVSNNKLSGSVPASMFAFTSL